MALVRATRLGIGSHGGKVKPGTQFEHEGPLASWMELVDGAEAPSPAPSEASPEAVEESTSEAVAVTETKARKPRKGAE